MVTDGMGRRPYQEYEERKGRRRDQLLRGWARSSGCSATEAGKSTTIRMLTGQLQTGRRGEVAGCRERAREKIKPFINLVFEGQNLYERLSGLDTSIFTDLYAKPKGRADDWKVVGLTRAAGRKVKPTRRG